MNSLFLSNKLLNNIFKSLFLTLAPSITLAAGTWCVMTDVHSVDTSGNNSDLCWVTGSLNVDGAPTRIVDLSICGNSSAAANSKNLSIALTAFTTNKKLAFWFDTYDSCSQVLKRWEPGAGRVSIRN